MKTDQVLLHQECSAEQSNEFQEAEHANEFIIAARFKSNYHFASKAIQDRVALVKLRGSVNLDKYLHKRECTMWALVTGSYYVDRFAVLFFPSLVLVC